MLKHQRIKSKMKKNLALLGHPIVSQHVPMTDWYSSMNFAKMITRYGCIYLKPDIGKQGKDVFRVNRINDSYCEISDNNSTRNVLMTEVGEALEILMDNKTYIIQENIDLATYMNCPFDIRMVMQKPYSTWELTLTSARVAQSERAVVTNVSQGAQDYPLHEIMEMYDQKQDSLMTLRELVDLAHQIAVIIGTRFTIRTIGLDMGIDKNGKIWFIEANTQPQCSRCKQVNDEYIIKKFELAKAIIKGK